MNKSRKTLKNGIREMTTASQMFGWEDPPKNFHFSRRPPSGATGAAAAEREPLTLGLTRLVVNPCATTAGHIMLILVLFLRLMELKVSLHVRPK
jgi:hypothetical protein